MQMPNVFVVPPEEDQSPAWCFFDAAHPTLSQIFDQPETPDIHVFTFSGGNDSSPFGTELPVSMDSFISPRNSVEMRSIVEALDDSNEPIIYHDLDTDSEYEPDTGRTPSSSHDEPFRTTRDTANDSDVVEVIKVGRNMHPSSKEDNDPQRVPLAAELKRSKTLKARASKAFRSLKGSLRTSKPRAQDVFTSVKSNSHHHSDIVTTSNTFPRPPTPPVSRRSSKIISQLFTSPSLKSRSSFSSFDDPSRVSQPEPVFFPAPSSPTQSSFVSASSVTDQLSCRSSVYENEPLQDEARLKGSSPIPIPAAPNEIKTKNRRFSILSLHKLFSFSSSTTSSESPISLNFDDSSCTTPNLRSTSCTPSSVCTTSGPQTPIYTDEDLLSRGKDTTPVPFRSTLGSNEVLNLGLGLSMDNSSDRYFSDEYTPRAQRTFRSSTSSESGTSTSKRQETVLPYPPTSSGPGVFQHEPGELSFEMRLDSLHFDSLSFDADRFCVN